MLLEIKFTDKYINIIYCVLNNQHSAEVGVVMEKLKEPVF